MISGRIFLAFFKADPIKDAETTRWGTPPPAVRPTLLGADLFATSEVARAVFVACEINQGEHGFE